MVEELYNLWEKGEKYESFSKQEKMEFFQNVPLCTALYCAGFNFCLLSAVRLGIRIF